MPGNMTIVHMLKSNQITEISGRFCVKTQPTYYPKTVLVHASTYNYRKITLTFTGNVLKYEGPSSLCITSSTACNKNRTEFVFKNY